MVRAVCQSALLAMLLLVLLALLPQVVLHCWKAQQQLLPACLRLRQARRDGASSEPGRPACP
jgi:hypothetical protein